MTRKISRSLNELLDYFPKVEPPITLTAEDAVQFSSSNKPIPSHLIAKFHSKWDEIDEYTELVPCFSLDVDQNFFTIVYWKGSLLSYEFILVTLDFEGEIISKKVIAGTLSNNQTIIQSVANIDENYLVYSMVGQDVVDSTSYQAKNSVAFTFEILPDGSILSEKEENKSWEEERQERRN